MKHLFVFFAAVLICSLLNSLCLAQSAGALAAVAVGRAAGAGISANDTSAPANVTMSYGALAEATLSPLWTQLVLQAASFTNATEPKDAKLLRKAIGSIRDAIDLFAFAYPKHPDHAAERFSKLFDTSRESDDTNIDGVVDQDQIRSARLSQMISQAFPTRVKSKQPIHTARDEDFLQSLRAELDLGHTVVGEYKDLADSEVPFSDDDVCARRDAVLRWKAAFFDADTVMTKKKFLLFPLTSRIVHRPPKALHGKCFWGTLGLQPDVAQSGLQNVALLLSGGFVAANQSQLSIAALPAQADLLLTNATVKHYHDVRKCVRSIMTCLTLFPTVLAASSAAERRQVDDNVDAAKQFYIQLGNVMDSVSAVHFFEGKGATGQAVLAKTQLEDRWRLLLAWMGRVDLAAVLTSLHAHLIDRAPQYSLL